MRAHRECRLGTVLLLSGHAPISGPSLRHMRTEGLGVECVSWPCESAACGPASSSSLSGSRRRPTTGTVPAAAGIPVIKFGPPTSGHLDAKRGEERERHGRHGPTRSPAGLEVGGRDVAGTVDLEDRDRNVEATPDVVDEMPLLPRVVVGAAERDQDVIGLELADGVVERRQRRLVADPGPSLRLRRDCLDVAEDDPEALVRFVAGAVRV